VAVGLLAGAVCFLILSSSQASAGTFTAVTCHDPAGNAAGTRGWGVAAANGQYITYAASCANGGQGSFGLTMGPNPTGNYFNGNGDTMSYSVPSGLTILSYSLHLYAFGGPCAIVNGQCANGFGQVWVNHTGQSDPNYDYRNLGNGAATPAVGASGLNGVNYVNVGVSCDPGQDLNYPCPGSANPEAQALVSGGTFTLLDSTVPSVANVSGSLIAGGALTGTDTISFTASDSGGGIYSAIALIDGHQAVQEVPDTNGGLCANLAQPSSATMAFAAPQPCRTTENISVPLDTTQLSPGQHHLQVMVKDVAGDEATAYDGTITIIGPGSPAVTRGALNGTNASDQAKLTAHWIRTRKVALTSRYGVRNRISGTLTTLAGQPISGAMIDVYATPAYQGAPARRIGGLSTGPAGQWTIALGGNVSSSALSLRYRSHVNDTIPIAIAALRLRVHAGIALRVVPHTASVGRKIFFRGVLHGAPIPSGGKQLVLEASSGGEWIQFDTIRTDARGRYHASYRFRFPGPVTYRFRVLSRYEADFPFLDGTSRNIAVHEH
jgi:hypothetical protein